MKPRIIVAALLALMAGTAAASDWQVVGIQLGTEARYEVDVATLVRNGPVVRAWVRTVFGTANKLSNGATARSARAFEYFNCADRQMEMRQITFYADANFSDVAVPTTQYSDAETVWRDIPPDSSQELVLDFVCKHAPPN
ncbi:MAG: hypothetical protein U1F09_02085 [Steroidobacteraceae bacterium]